MFGHRREKERMKKKKKMVKNCHNLFVVSLTLSSVFYPKKEKTKV
jgi:hypothetical protein